jgi:dihydropyrimidinase
LDELLIRGGKVATPTGVVEADLLIQDGRIATIEPDLLVQAEETLQLHGELILPGGVDVHVHLPWPTGSFISSDDLSSGTKAAAFGGVTTVIDFIIPNEDENLADTVVRKRRLAHDHAWVDYGLHVTLRGEVRENMKHVPGLIQAGYPSYKVFMAYEGFRVADEDLPVIFQTVGEAGGMLDVHAEDGLLADRLTSELVRQGKTALADYPLSRPAEVEIHAIEKILDIQAIYKTPLHVHHVSTRRGAELIGAARSQGRQVSAETCPHYLLFDQTGYAGDLHQAAQLVCAPSIKTADDREGLWDALARDWLNVLATDHCPYTLAQKEADLTDFTHIPGGVGGVELRLPLLYNAGVLSGRLTLDQFVNLWATNPARIFGLYPRKGVIEEDSDADLVIFDPERHMTVRAVDLKMNSDCTPYEGHEVTGWPVATFLRGKALISDGKTVVDSPFGEFIPRFLNAKNISHEK